MRGVISAALFALVSACAVERIALVPPDGFLVLQEPGRDVKATSADGARLWIREFVDRDGGELEFWADAVEHDFVRNRGYELLERTPIRDAANRDGVVQRYRVQADGEPHGYLVAIFVIGDHVRVAEFAASKPVYDLRVGAVQTALASLR